VEGGCIHNVIRAHLGAEHGKAIVVLGRDHDVLHAGILGDADPFIGIELHRIKLLGELLIFADGDFGVVHHPFANALNRLALPLAGRYGVKPPVNKHPKTGLTPPVEPGIGHLLGRVLRRGRLLR